MRTAFLLAMTIVSCWAESLLAAGTRPNVLFIAIDDLNHWVGYLGRNPQTKTPNIDQLAARGVWFTRSYCAAPVCNPSRAALMSGLRPSPAASMRTTTIGARSSAKDLPLTTAFRKAGYYVCGAGKIYHEAYPRRSEWDDYLADAGRDPQPKGPDTGVGGIKFAPLDCGDEDLREWKIVQLRHRATAEEARPAVLPRRRPAQAAHALECARANTTTCIRWTRSICRPTATTIWTDLPAGRRADGASPTATIARSSTRAAGRKPCRATWQRSPTATR